MTRQAFPTTPDGTGSFGPVETITPLQVLRSADGRTFTLRTPPSFPSGYYVVTGGGPNVQATRREFYFRDFPNEARNISGTGARAVTNWKWSPGSGENDDLIVNLPGQLAPIETRGIRSLIAHSDILLLNQTVNLPATLQALAGLRLDRTTFGPGATDAHGPLAIDSISDLGTHVLNVRGGGYLLGNIRLTDPDAALVNHPGSTLVLSNRASIGSIGIDFTNTARFVNLGALRALGDAGAFASIIGIDDVRLRNDGRIEAATGGLRIFHLENEGMIDVAAGAKLFLPLRTRGGVLSRITGDGDVEFGEYDTTRRRVVWAADAEVRGEFDMRGKVTLVTGQLTIWRPSFQPAGTVELQNQSTLNLLTGGQIGTLAIPWGNLVCNGDTRIGSLNGGSISIRSTTAVQVTGDARWTGSLDATGPGVVEFMGATTAGNTGNSARVLLRNATVRNRGTWKSIGGNSISANRIVLLLENGRPGAGVFENAGLFEVAPNTSLTITAPFRNAGRMVCGPGTVTIDARQDGGAANFGAYLPQPGCELALNGAEFRQAYGGQLDLTAGTLSGAGSIQPGVAAGDALGKVINRAVLRVGNPVGELFIQASNFEQTAAGEIVVTLSATGASLLRLREGATLAGTFTVELAEGFSPAIGQAFNVIRYSSRTGVFDTLKLPVLGGGKKLEVIQGSGAVVVRVVAE